MRRLVLLAALVASAPAHARQSVMVQCEIGPWSAAMPDYACDAMERGASRLAPNDMTIRDCAMTVQSTLGLEQWTWGQFVTPCSQIWTDGIGRLEPYRP